MVSVICRKYFPTLKGITNWVFLGRKNIFSLCFDRMIWYKLAKTKSLNHLQRQKKVGNNCSQQNRTLCHKYLKFFRLDQVVGRSSLVKSFNMNGAVFKKTSTRIEECPEGIYFQIWKRLASLTTGPTATATATSQSVCLSNLLSK